MKPTETLVDKALASAFVDRTGNASFVGMTQPIKNAFTHFAGKTPEQLGLKLTTDQYNTLVSHGFIFANQFVDGVAEGLSYESLYAGFTFMSHILKFSISTATNRISRLGMELTKMLGTRWLGGAAAQATTAGLVSYACWGGSTPGEALKKGMRENIRSNMHQVGVHAGGYVYTTPSKNLVYHTFIKKVGDDVKEAVIYAGTDKKQGTDASTVTSTFGRNVFQNKKNLEKVRFHENNISTNEGMPMLLTIPDSAFYGCDNLTEFSTILESANGQQALGPESFILAGDSVFVGLDPNKFHILIDESYKEAYLASESWAPLKRYFKYTNTLPKREHDEYGGWYAYAYENGSLQKVHKVQGHKIEHMIVTEPDNDFLSGHQGALKLCNDIGSYNNYQLDAVRYKAFYGNNNLRVVNFTDLKGTTGFGDVYTGLDVTLEDSCFANCPNLANIDMLYLVTDGRNRIDPITPSQVKLGRGVLDGTTAQIKMMPKQVEWFEADTTWVKYRDRFLPCIISPVDDEVKSALDDMAYYDMAHTGYDDKLWTDYIDLARIAGAGFSWLDGKFKGKAIRSFNDFRHFECVGLDYVGSQWFSGCTKLSSIALPKTVKTIGESAFRECVQLTSIDLPAAVETIEADAFRACPALTTVHVLGATPATLSGTGQFTKNAGLKIYVPEASVAAYKQAWAEYKDFIVSDKTMQNRKVVTVTAPGQLAEKLSLTTEKESGKIRYLRGEYASIDSLTVTGPLGGEDLGVIRHLAGADAYDSDPTDGCLRYLNLWNATIKRDDEHSYNGNGSDEYIDQDNKVPDYLFENCTSIQTVVFPKTVTHIGENIFEDATSLRKVCVGTATTTYECDILQSLSGIEELVLLTAGYAKSEYDDPWEAPIQVAYTTNAQISNYMGDTGLTRRAGYVVTTFDDDAVINILADRGQFFPSEYLTRTSVENLFNDNHTIVDFEDFIQFVRVKTLDRTFMNATALRTIALPDSIHTIGVDAFAGCVSLDTIYVACDSVPTLAAGALRYLPADFRIMVPKRLCKLYRTKWAEYADHINVDESLYDSGDVITVTLTEPNTLAQALGLKIIEGGSLIGDKCLNGVIGDYSHVRKLKVIGPISGADFDLMRHMAGWCPWVQTRNMAGHLEYIDLYDAKIMSSKSSSDWCVNGELSGLWGNGSHLYSVNADELPYHAFLKAYNLKTLILPKSCTKVRERALQECEDLEVIVIGDDCEKFNWNALDDDASLTRMYFLAKKKVDITTQNAIWRALCNNYNPTFDAFYVRPSQLNDYRNDKNYTSSSWQRTNNIQCGIFTDDDSFLPFAAHAAVTRDDLATVTNVDGWFSNHPDTKDLTALGYTSILSLRVSEMQQLTKLQKIELPMTFQSFYDDLEVNEHISTTVERRPFAFATGLRYVNMLQCDSTMVIDELRGDIKRKLAIASKALVYLPDSYGETDEHNVVWGNIGDLQNNYYDFDETEDYNVPLAFTTRHISNQRLMKPRTGMSTSYYTVSLPYDLPVPAGAKAYQLDSRSQSTLNFQEVQGRLTAGAPYLLVLTNEQATLGCDLEQTVPTTAEAEAAVGMHQVDVPGYSMRGAVKAIDNATAHDLGAYILQSDNKWHPVPAGTKAVNIPAFRTYLLQNGGASGVRAFDMKFFDNDTVGIDTIKTVDADGTERLYDLNGRQIDAARQHGVYIQDGKKRIVK